MKIFELINALKCRNFESIPKDISIYYIGCGEPRYGEEKIFDSSQIKITKKDLPYPENVSIRIDIDPVDYTFDGDEYSNKEIESGQTVCISTQKVIGSLVFHYDEETLKDVWWDFQNKMLDNKPPYFDLDIPDKIFIHDILPYCFDFLEKKAKFDWNHFELFDDL